MVLYFSQAPHVADYGPGAQPEPMLRLPVGRLIASVALHSNAVLQHTEMRSGHHALPEPIETCSLRAREKLIGDEPGGVRYNPKGHLSRREGEVLSVAMSHGLATEPSRLAQI